MIASVVATLEENAGRVPNIIKEISKLSGVEIGEIDKAARRVPITIDSPVADAIEETTRRLQECQGVAFVDVVFVHLENESEQTIAAASE